LGPNILLNTLFSNTLSLRSSLNVSDQVSHPYKTTRKIIVLYILIFKFLDIKLEDERLMVVSRGNPKKLGETPWLLFVYHKYPMKSPTASSLGNIFTDFVEIG
jgi:hypothetical protein